MGSSLLILNADTAPVLYDPPQGSTEILRLVAFLMQNP
jgi:hypothetical protein